MKKLICVVCKKVRSTRRKPENDLVDGHGCKPCRRKAGLDYGEPASLKVHPKRNKHKAKTAQPKKAGKKKKRGEE